MKSNVRRELYWLMPIMMITLIVGLAILDGELWNSQRINIQFPNEDISISKKTFLLIVFFTLFVGGSLTKIIHYMLANRVAAGILILLFVLVLGWELLYFRYINGFHYHIAEVEDKGDYFQKLYVPGSREFKAMMLTLIFVTTIILAVLVGRFFNTKRFR